MKKNTKYLIAFGILKKVIMLAAFLWANGWSAPLKVGVTAGPHAMIMEKVKEAATKAGLEIQIIEFNDFMLPNRALNDKEIDANSYQHQPFLDEQNKAMNFKLVSIGKTVLMPLGIYPGKVKAISDLKDGDEIAIPNDPTNGGRALKLLEKAGLLKLKAAGNPTVQDITANPKNLKIVELDAPQVTRSLPDVAMGIINTDWVILAKMDPKSALLTEDKDSPYTNILVVREGDESRKDIKQLVDIYHSDEIKAFVDKEFKGAVIAGW